MPPPLLVDLDQVDLSRVLLSQADIYALLPHRHEFKLLDGVSHIDQESRRIVAYRDVGEKDWWVRGHIPGRPLLPGVLMLEMAAQTMAVLARRCGGVGDFLAFGGVDECKFRDAVVPPARLYLLGAGLEQRSRRVVCRAQGVAAGKLIFEAVLTGLTMR